MGFGFNLFFFPILVALVGLALIYTAILIVLALIRKDSNALKNILKGWLIAIGVILSVPLLAYVVKPFISKKIVDESDTYGEYVVDRKMFAGQQADWQYEHFRFEIKKDSTFLFYVTDKEKILKTYKGHVSFHTPYTSVRIEILMDEPKHHIIEKTPTLYRNIWSFYYVFNSDKFGNVFFKKGKWKPLNQ